MKFLKDGILVDVTKKTIKIYFQDEKQKQQFDSKFTNLFKMKYPGRVVISDIADRKIIEDTFKLNNYDVLDNMRSLLNKQVKTIGILMTKDVCRIRGGKYKIQLYFKTPMLNKGYAVIMFDDVAQEFEIGKMYEVKGVIEKDEYYSYKKTDYEIGFVPYTLKANFISEITDQKFLSSFEKHYDKPRYEFHLHTNMSGKDAFIRSEDMIKAAKENKLAGAAITDHGVAHALPYFQKDINGSKQELKLFFGMEAYMVDDTKILNKLPDLVRQKLADKLKEINSNIANEDLLNMVDETDVIETLRDMTKEQKETLIKEELQHEINDGKRYHITMLCNQSNSELDYRGNKIIVNESIKALNELITRSYKEGFSAPKIKENKFQGKRPCVLKSWLMEKNTRNKFLLGSACAFGEIKDICMKSDPNENTHYELMKEKLNFYDYVELMPLHNDTYSINHKDYPFIKNLDDVKSINNRLYNLVENYNNENPNCKKLVIFTSDAHIMDKEEQEIRAIFKYGQIGNILSKTEPENVFSVYEEFKIKDQPYVFSYDEMKVELLNQGFSENEIELIYNNEKILADKLPDGRLTTIIPNFMFVPDFPGINVKEEVPKLAKEFAANKWSSTGNYEDVPLEIRERLEFEINKTAERNFEFLYYVARHSVKLSNDNGYIVGSRGLKNNRVS